MSARLVLVGAGSMGRAWIGAIDRSADAELVGLVDLDQRVLEDALAQRGARVATGDDAVAVAAETGADAIVNVTVPAAHLPVNLAALDAGLPVLCEKPVTPTVRDALVLAAAAERAGRLLMVSQSRRYYAALELLKARLPELGGMSLVRAEYLMAPHFGGFREQMAHPLLIDMSIHAFDVARFLVGGLPVRVDARSWNPAWSWYRGDAAATALFEFDGGQRFDYLGDWVTAGLETSWNGAWRIGAEQGSASWDGEDDVVIQRGARSLPEAGSVLAASQPAERITVPRAPAETIDGSLAEFLGALGSGATPYGEIHDNVFTLAMVEAAVRSADTGATVEIAALIDEAWAAALEAGQRPDLHETLESWGSGAGHLAGVTA